jgi:hypothetical protein
MLDIEGMLPEIKILFTLTPTNVLYDLYMNKFKVTCLEIIYINTVLQQNKKTIQMSQLNFNPYITCLKFPFIEWSIISFGDIKTKILKYSSNSI